MHGSIAKGYEEFRKSVQGTIVEKLEWKDLATFVPNKSLPVYNWFYYKEGFSRQLVEELIKMFSLSKNSVVLDPFCGVGTTLLACKQNGIDAVGYDVLPISVFASRVKTANYDIEKLKENARKISKGRFIRLQHNFPPLIRKAFNKYALEDIAFVRSQILELEPEVREFFTLALINAAMKCSYAYKDGSAIKIKKRPAIPLRKMLKHVTKKMIKDAEKILLSEKTNADIRVELNDARRLPLSDDSVDAVITSPPYLNQIDYTKVYAIEEFFIHGDPMPGVRAFVGMRTNNKESDFLSELDMPLQARLYFEDMNEALKEVYRVLKKDGKAAIVVGNGYVDGVIESDIILSYLAQQIGFRLVNIYVLNTRFALEERITKKGILRESMIILEK
jgi:DNA modification methylase